MGLECKFCLIYLLTVHLFRASKPRVQPGLEGEEVNLENYFYEISPSTRLKV